ncbi:MAG: efflux RND transporter periplasmic adaptor subunit [Gammaproteobacteria bacterium]|nr:efflux RND transporter periplasmic adaptor subunit [Gammaproteobacteria bacterium]
MNRLTLFVIIAALAPSSLLLDGCSDSSAQAKATPAQAAVPAIPVEVARVRYGDAAATYAGTTTLEAAQESIVVAKVAGTVARIYVEEGNPVRPGQALAKLDDATLRFDFEQAQANYEKKKQEFERSDKLYARHLISADAYEGGKYDLAVLKANYDIAKLNLDNTVIRTPIGGVVAKRFIKVGNTLTANQSVFTVSNFDPLLAVLYVPEIALPLLKVDQPATLSADAVPDKSFNGSIARISPVVDPQTGTFKVTVVIHHDQGVLAPGMFSRVRITYDVHRHSLLVPRASVVTEDGETTVYAVRDGVAHRLPVTLGYANGNLVEITRGLQAGDIVVTLGQNNLRDRAKVAVTNPPAPQTDVAAVTPSPQV